MPAPDASHFAMLSADVQHGFEFSAFLNVCGRKLRHLDRFHLPIHCELTNEMCERMCIMLPHLTFLNLRNCYAMPDSAMVYIAQLPLTHFYPPQSISEVGVKILCDEHSLARLSLNVFHLPFEPSTGLWHLMLKCMKRLKMNLKRSNSLWLQSLPMDLAQQTFCLTTLFFDSAVDNVIDELQTAVSAFPRVEFIKIGFDVFADIKLLHLLKMFKFLEYVDITVVPNENPNLENEMMLDQADHGLCFPSLKGVIFNRCDNGWVSHGYYLSILDMCPKLKRLQLLHCDGFTNKTAYELACWISKKKLHDFELEICNCRSFDPNGVEELMKTRTLTCLTLVFSQPIDDHTIECLFSGAKEYGVNLILSAFDDVYDEPE